MCLTCVLCGKIVYHNGVRSTYIDSHLPHALYAIRLGGQALLRWPGWPRVAITTFMLTCGQARLVRRTTRVVQIHGRSSSFRCASQTRAVASVAATSGPSGHSCVCIPRTSNAWRVVIGTNSEPSLWRPSRHCKEMRCACIIQKFRQRWTLGTRRTTPCLCIARPCEGSALPCGSQTHRG